MVPSNKWSANLGNYFVFLKKKYPILIYMKLTADIGNTMSKLGVFDGSNLVEVKTFKSNDSKKDISRQISSLGSFSSIIFSAVGENKQNYNDAFPNKYIIELSQSTPLPIQLNYSSPETLGVDRIALAVGANALFPNENVLTIDAGTCVTYDFVEKNGIYQGGAISPGLRMRLVSLHNETNKLPFIEAPNPITNIELIGKDTKSSILSGVVNGLANEIIETIKSYNLKYNNLLVLFTGGDSAFFNNHCSNLLESKKNEIFADPYLTLKGLNVILDYNENR